MLWRMLFINVMRRKLVFLEPKSIKNFDFEHTLELKKSRWRHVVWHYLEFSEFSAFWGGSFSQKIESANSAQLSYAG